MASGFHNQTVWEVRFGHTKSLHSSSHATQQGFPDITHRHQWLPLPLVVVLVAREALLGSMIADVQWPDVKGK